MQESGRSHTPPIRVAIVASVVVLCLALFSMQVGRTTANLDVTIYAVLVLSLMVALLWRPGEPPVLLFATAFQWVQVSVKTFHANFLGLSLDQMLPWAPAASATVVALSSLVALTVGIALGAGRSQGQLEQAARDEASGMSIVRLVQMHVFMMLAVEALAAIGGYGGMRQIIGSLAQLRFATLFALGYVTLTQRRGIGWFAAFAALEIVNSLGGFFAGFRMPVYVALLAVAATMRRITPLRLASVIVLACGALYLAVVWQTIKGDYRDIANQGTGEQVVQLDRGEQFEALADLWSDANGDLAARGVEGLAQRLAYVDLLAYSIQFVPNTRPHTGGDIWLGALAHIAVPRLLWPEKPELESDTEVTRAYTGLGLLSARNDTSISIGYVGDAYIDFGEPAMYAVLFSLGIVFGLLYRALLVLKNGLVVIRYGLLVAIFLVLASFEITAVKLLGGLLMPWIVGCAGSRLFLAELTRWLRRDVRA